MKQTSHFFVFWEAAFGDNSTSSSVSSARHLDVNDLLYRAEKIYDTDVNIFDMATVGASQAATR